MNKDSNLRDNFQNARILVAEDHPGVLERIEKRLTRYGYHDIRTATSAAESFQILEDDRAHFDIIVADMFMEKENSGFEILQQVKEKNITSTVIILTANDNTEDARYAFRNGAWDYISKNWRGDVFEMLHNSIQDALRYYSHWTHRDNEAWIRANREMLQEKYSGQFIAVLNQAVLAYEGNQGKLEIQIDEMKLPRFLTAVEYIQPSLPRLDAALTVLVEGPTDVKYLNAAACYLGEEVLMGHIHVDTVGNNDGQEGNGWKALKQGFDFLMHNPKLHPNAILFLFDNDVRHNQLPNKGEDYQNLYIRQIGDYSEKCAGIEYLLTEQIFEDGFNQNFIGKDLGRITSMGPIPQPEYVIKEQNKMALCNWVCCERQNEVSDFAQFQRLFNIFRELLPVVF